MMRTRRQSTLRLRWPAFTLVEMVVVVGIVIVLLGIALPAVSKVWDERRVAAARSTLRGALMLARRNALTPETGDCGLLFALDGEGRQKIYMIRQELAPLSQVESLTNDEPYELPIPIQQLASERRFVLMKEEFTLPLPLRAVPRYVIDPESSNQPEKFLGFSDEELVNEDFEMPQATLWQERQRHRNYFTLIFSGSDGRLVPRRDVLIVDEPIDTQEGPVGIRTGLPVADVAVVKYNPQDRPSSGGPTAKIDPTDSLALKGLIIDPASNLSDPSAINFSSVDGVLLYDNDAFVAAGDAVAQADLRRQQLINTAQPFYVAGLSGEVIAGPLGENEVPSP